MAGYIRQSTFSDGDTITAALFNNEYDQLLNVFSNTSGHKHDGTAAEGPVIGLIGDAGLVTPLNKILIDTTNDHIEFWVDVSGTSTQQLYIADGAILPVTDNDIDLGSSSLEFKDLFIDGTANIDSLVADTADINGGSLDNVTIGATTAAAGTFTTVDTSGNVTVGGNLTVSGTTTTVNSNEVNIGDNIIVLNSDETGTPSQNSGIEVERGTSTNVSLLWNETNDYWTFGSNHLNFPDNSKAYFGTGNDLEIYHDGSNNASYIKETGAGSLFIEASNLILQREAGTENFIECITNGAVTLFYDGVAKLATTSAGIDVTGGIDTTGDISISNAGPTLKLIDTDNNPDWWIKNGNGNLRFIDITNIVDVLALTASGANFTGNVGIGTTSPIGKLDVSDGTNPVSIDSGSTYNEIQSYNRPLYVNRQGNNTILNSGGGNVGIGTTSPAVNLDVQDSSQAVIRAGDGSTVDMRMVADVSSGVGSIRTSGNTSVMGFFTGGSERARIDSSGRVGIGTTSPASALHIRDTSNAEITIQDAISSATARIGVYGAGGNLTYDTNASGQHIFTTNNRATEFMRINSSGNVGIGTDSPSSLLHVAGDALVTGNLTVNGNLTFGNAATDTVSFGADIDSHIIPDDDDTYDLGSSSQEWKDLYIDGVVYADQIDLGDNEKIRFGASQDLEIYHDGSQSLISETGTGNLSINGTSINFNNNDLGGRYAEFVSNGAVNLFHAGSKKFATTSSGIDVSGTTQTESLIVEKSFPTIFLNDTATTDKNYRIANGSSGTFTITETNDAGAFVANRFTISPTGRVGIGTTSPSAKLDVVGNITHNGIFTQNAGSNVNSIYSYSTTSTAQPSLVVGDDVSGSATRLGLLKYYGSATSVNLFGQTLGGKVAVLATGSNVGGLLVGTGTSANAPVYMGTNGTLALTIDTSQRVGIGTTSPTHGLTVVGSADSDASSYISINDPNNATLSRVLLGVGSDGDGQITLKEDGNSTTVFINSEGNSYFNGGNIGIGTTAPNGKLDVSNVQNAANQFTSPHLRLRAASTTDNTGFTGVAYSVSTVDNYGWTVGAVRGTTGNNSDFVFNIHNNSASGSEKMRIDGGTGNVGIGTTNPTNLLSVESTGQFAGINIKSASANGVSYIDFGDADDSNAGGINYDNSTDTLNLRSGDANRVFINSSGNVGIGTSSPSHELSISKTATGITDNPTLQIINAWTTEGNNVGFSNRALALLEAGNGTVKTRIQTRYDTNANLGEIGTETNHDFRFVTNNIERARIDSSGNFLVGKTTSASSTAGLTLEPAGALVATRSGGEGLIINRLTSEGALVKFRYANSEVGNIGSLGSYLTIGDDDTAIRFHAGVDAILPHNSSTNANRDDAISLGTSTERFKDLHLSGNANIDGNLTVSGTTLTINTTDLNVEDKNITINYSTGDSSSTADGAGITIQDAVDASTDASLTWDTTLDAFKFSNTLHFDDGIQANFGTSSDLQILHDGSHSYIKDVGTGSLRIRGTDLLLESQGGETFLYAANNGAVTLYHDNAAKLATTSSGIDVSGSMTASGIDNLLYLQSGATGTPTLRFEQGTTRRAFLRYQNAGQFDIINEYGDVALWTGTSGSESQKMTVKQSGNVGIGTTSPSKKLHVQNGSSGFSSSHNDRTAAIIEGSNSAGTVLSIMAPSTGISAVWFGDEVQEFSGQLNYDHSINAMKVIVNGSEKARFNYLGDFGIGTTSPSAKLDVAAGNITAGVKGVEISGSTSYIADGSHGTSLDISHTYSSNDGSFRAINIDLTDSGSSNQTLYGLYVNAEANYLSGNVGIGTSSVQSGTKVAIHDGATSVASSSGRTLQVASDTTPTIGLYLSGSPSTGDTVGNFDFIANNSSGDQFEWTAARIDSYLVDATGGSRRAGMRFYTSDPNGQTNETMRIDNTGNVGIGTTSPSRTLQVVSTGTTTGGAYVYSNAIHTGSDTHSLLSVRSDNASATGTVVDIRGDGTGDILNVKDGTNSALIVKDGGNVGIGTDSPMTKLHVFDGDGSYPDDVNNHLVVESDSHSYIGLGGGTSSDVGIHFGDSGGIARGRLAYLNGSDAMAFSTAATERVRIDSSGNVGIGTSSPLDKLTVNGNLSIFDNKLYNGSASNSAGLDFGGSFVKLHGYNGIVFYSSTAGVGSQTERMRITNTGNVGIGTTSPSAKLDVAGGIEASGDLVVSSTNLFVDVSTDRVGMGTSSPTRPLHVKDSNDVVAFFESTDSTAVVHIKDQNTGVSIGSDSSGNGQFSADIDQVGSKNILFKLAGSEKVRIDSSGNVAIGATSATNKVEITANGLSKKHLSVIDSDNTTGRGSFYHNGSTTYIETQGTSGTGTLIIRGSTVGASPTFCTFNSTGVTVAGALSKGSGSFKIDHPLKPETHHLVHSFVEGPQADNLYSGEVELINGQAQINLDEWFGMTEGTLVALNRDFRVFTTNETDWDNVKGSIENNILTIICQNPDSNATVSWLVIGERQDKEIYESILTDDNGKIIVEPQKVTEE